MGNGIDIGETLNKLIVALCDDYDRRGELIELGVMPRRVDMELRYLNFKIYDATAEVVGEGDAEKFIHEIGKKIGYARTSFSDISEGTYKKYKLEVIKNIARRMYLVS